MNQAAIAYFCSLMKQRFWIPFLLMLLVFPLLFLVGGGCANILPPSGGPRDSLPPVLLRATPADSTLNFTGKQFQLLFDEYVEIDDPYKNLIISPVPQNMPNVTRKLETISVRLRDDLEPNTTYVFNFGKSIKDLNEGNIFRDFTYVVSTGNYFDSMQLTGSVMLAETGGVDTTLFVLLHRSGEDSALQKEKPRYVTRVDTSGSYRFRYLAPGTYYLYALQDESGAYRYLSPEQQIFAFANEPVQISASTNEAPQLLAYKLPTPPAAASSSTSSQRGGRRDREEKRLRYSTNLKGSQQDLLSAFVLSFDTPIRDLDTSKILFSTDSSFTPVADAFSWTPDSLRKQWTLQHEWKENTYYHLVFAQDFATDTLGQQLLKSDTLSFYSKKKTDYGRINLRFRNLDLESNPVLQFVQNKMVVYSAPLTEAQFTRPLFLPGDYSLRILNDSNGNGIWDPGSFFGGKRQPEVAKPLKRTITVKPGQDFPIEIDVEQE